MDDDDKKQNENEIKELILHTGKSHENFKWKDV